MSEEPDQSIMEMVNNTGELYALKEQVFDQWVDQGDRWTEDAAHKEALGLAVAFARSIEHEMRHSEWKYNDIDVRMAAREILEEFPEYREYELERRIQQTMRKPTPEELRMDEGDIRHAEKYDKIARKIGIDLLRSLIPATPEEISSALERGDKHLTTIKNKKWDDAAKKIKGHDSLEKFMALKHVATWYYA